MRFGARPRGCWVSGSLFYAASRISSIINSGCLITSASKQDEEDNMGDELKMTTTAREELHKIINNICNLLIA